MFQLVSIATLQPQQDVVLASPITARDGSKLFNKGETITKSLLGRLQQCGIDDVIVHDLDLKQLTGEQGSIDAAPSRESTGRVTIDQISHPETLRVSATQNPFSECTAHHGAAPYNGALLSQFMQDERVFLAQLAEAFESFGQSDGAKAENLLDISDNTCGQIGADKDLVLNLAVQPTEQADLVRRRLNVGKLAACIGVTVGLNKAMLEQLSVGCFIHDVGLAREKQTVCQHTASRVSLGSVRSHPDKMLSLLEPYFDVIPETSLIVAHQIHERIDGSGYPCGRTGDEIHDLAKIAAVADMFAALIAPGPGREAVLPYHAMKSILVDVKQGLFDADVVRAMLTTLSVCPVGSFVELSDDRVAQVVRANRGSFNKPIVQISDSTGFSAEAGIVDLASDRDLKIRRAIPPPATAGLEQLMAVAE